MAHPYHHALASVKKWGGEVSDYLPLHNWFDQSKSIAGDFRHRALRHHAEGIFMLETIFGPTITLSTGRVIPTRYVGESTCSRISASFRPSPTGCARSGRCRGWAVPAASTTGPITRRRNQPKTESGTIGPHRRTPSPPAGTKSERSAGKG